MVNIETRLPHPAVSARSLITKRGDLNWDAVELTFWEQRLRSSEAPPACIVWDHPPLTDMTGSCCYDQRGRGSMADTVVGTEAVGAEDGRSRSAASILSPRVVFLTPPTYPIRST